MAESTAKCEISQEHLECPICLRLFKDPKILDCLHSFCQSCLEDLVSKYQPDADKIICPVCRKTTDIPDSRCANLKSSFFLSSLVDDVNKREKKLGETSAFNMICEECEDGLEAISRCMDCNENICQQCEAAHKRLRHTKKHRNVSNLFPSPSQDVTAKDPYSPKCRQHPDHDISLYCETCKILICLKCGVTDHRSAEHTLNGIADAVVSHRKDVDDVMKMFQKSKKEFQVLQESISHSRKRLKLMVAKACDDVSAKEKEEIAKIQTKARLLRDEITKLGKDRDEEYEKVFNSNRDKMEKAKAAVVAVSDLMERADDFEMLDLKSKVMHNLEFQKELVFEHGKHRMSFICVKCQDVVSDTDLGEIHEEKWVFKETIPSDETDPKFRPQYVGAMQNGDIAVLDRDAAAISVFTSSGRFKNFLNAKDVLQKPLAMAVTRDDLMMVTDGEFVKVFNTDQQLISQFRPAPNESGELRESKLDRIATDAQNRVAVEDDERNVIYVTNLDGSLISVIPTSLCPFGIAFQHEDRLILSDYRAGRLLCLDFAGHEVFSVSTEINGQLMRPCSVCCDEAGNIYVTFDPPDDDTGGNSEVHQYTAQGVHVQCIARGLIWPFDMTLSRRGELLVAEQKSVKIFSRL